MDVSACVFVHVCECTECVDLSVCVCVRDGV